MSDDGELLDRLGSAVSPTVPEPSPERVAAVREAALRARADRNDDRTDDRTDDPADGSTAGVSGRRALLLSVAAAAAGVVGGAVIMNAADDEAPAAAPEPPTEPLRFSVSTQPGSSVAGKVINHTWGVELLLDADGFPVGSAYRVVYRDVADAVVEAGGFVGASIPIHCRCNAALLRDGIAAIEIRSADDTVVSRADFA